MSSDLPGVNPATLNWILLYYRLMTKWSGLGDITELSRVGLSQRVNSSHSAITGDVPQRVHAAMEADFNFLKNLGMKRIHPI
jgi:hypothetical protein